MNIHPLYLLRHTGLVSALQLLISQATPFVDEACMIMSGWKNKKKKHLEESFRTVRSHLASFMGALCRVAEQ